MSYFWNFFGTLSTFWTLAGVGVCRPRLFLRAIRWHGLSLLDCVDLKQKFMAHVDKRPWGCWLWKGSINKATKYGLWRGRPAHRWAYELFKGQIPTGLDLDHLCRVRDCVNPDHLEPVTMQENFKRGLRPQQVEAVRRLQNYGLKLLLLQPSLKTR